MYKYFLLNFDNVVISIFDNSCVGDKEKYIEQLISLENKHLEMNVLITDIDKKC